MSTVFFTTGNKPRAIVSIRRSTTGQPQPLNALIHKPVLDVYQFRVPAEAQLVGSTQP